MRDTPTPIRAKLSEESVRKWEEIFLSAASVRRSLSHVQKAGRCREGKRAPGTMIAGTENDERTFIYCQKVDEG